MAGWHSLAGYLHLRLTGPLGRLISKRHYWFVLDEESCELLYYKNEADAATKKSAVGRISVKGAGIALSLQDSNQFTINSQGKKHILLADNHESMMIWLLALQAKRDAHNDKTSMMAVDERLAQQKEEDAERKRTESLPSDQELQAIIRRASLAESRQSELNRSRSLKIPRGHGYHSLNLGSNRNYDNHYRNPDHQRIQALRASQANRDHFRRSTTMVRRASSELNIPKRDNDKTDNESEDSRSEMMIMSCNIPSTEGEDIGRSTDQDLSVTFSDVEFNISTNEHRLIQDTSCSDVQMQNGQSSGNVSDDALWNKPTMQRQSSVQSKITQLRKMNSKTNIDNVCDIYNISRDSSLSNKSHEESNMKDGKDCNSTECSHVSRLRELEFELMSTKCELAKVLNRESSYKNTIEENTNKITKLENDVKKLRVTANQDGNRTKIAESHEKFDEKCRIFQNQNRFLNEEVLKLSRMWQTEQVKHLQMKQQLKEMETQLEHFKRDYLLLLQSSISISNCDGPETLEVHLYGGSRHKQRIKEMLSAARLINPSLPTYEGLSKSVTHVDSLGFRHTYNSEGLILHYICRQLSQHYSNMLQSHEVHQISWRNYLRNHDDILRSTKQLKMLVRGGIPSHCRQQVWRMLIRARINDVIEEKGPHYYNNLISIAPESQVLSINRKQITLDLLRTMPTNVHFCSLNSDGVKKMQETLLAFCLHNPTLGYCQGMNFIVGMSLLFMSAEDSFWCLVAITERYFTPHYFDQNLIGAQADQEVLKDLLREKLPKLSAHLESMEIELCTVTLNWFLAIFFDSVPFETLVRIWDCYLLEGPKVLFRMAIAILKMNESNLLDKTDTVSIMRQLKASAKLCYDVDGLIEMAFKGVGGFPKRKDIAAKQSCYLKTLKDTLRKKQIEKEVMKKREQILSEEELMNQDAMILECGAVYEKDKIWLCFGKQNESAIVKVNCEESITYPLNMKFGSRIMCIHDVNDHTVVLGFLSHVISAFNTRTREETWSVRVNDTVLSLCSHVEDSSLRMYAALADGTIAVIEGFHRTGAFPEMFFILIGTSPVTCVQVIGQRLWCGCGNKVILLHARTLDTVDQFQTTSSSLDHIMSIRQSDHGVWVTIRGSTMLELWDPETLTCKLLFDIKNKQISKALGVVEETQINQGRITATLSVQNTIWVGTADGYLIIYNITSKLPRPNSEKCLTQKIATENENNAVVKEFRETSKKRERYDSGCYTNISTSTTSHSSMNTLTSTVSLKTGSTSSETNFEDAEKKLINSSMKPEDEIDGKCLLLSPLNEDVACSSGSTANSSMNVSVCSAVTVKSQLKIDETDGSIDDRRTPNCRLKSSKSLDSISDMIKKCASIWKSKLRAKNTNDLPTPEESPKSADVNPKRRFLVRHMSLEEGRDFESADFLDFQSNAVSEASPGLQQDQRAFINRPIQAPPSSTCTDNTSSVSEHGPKKEENGREWTCAASTEQPTVAESADSWPLKCRTVKSMWMVSMKGRTLKNNLKNCSSLVDLCDYNDAKKKKKKSRPISSQTYSVENIASCSESGAGSIIFGSLDFDDVFIAYHTEDELQKRIANKTAKNWADENVRRSNRSNRKSAMQNGTSCDDFINGSSESLTPQVLSSLYGDVNNRSMGKRPRIGMLLANNNPIKGLKTIGGNILHPPNMCSNGYSYESVSPGWSSVDDTSTALNETLSTSNNVNDETKTRYNYRFERQTPSLGGAISDTASNISFSSCEVLYAFELVMKEKIKVSDNPIKCLLQTSNRFDEPVVISCSGYYGEDEGILKWYKRGELWTNDPVVEVCPYTNQIKPSQYVRSRLPERSSESEKSSRRKSSSSSVTSTNTVVNKMHSIFSSSNSSLVDK